jgi:hypothetical protein
MNADEENKVPEGQTGPDGKRNAVIKYCRACELSCPILTPRSGGRVSKNGELRIGNYELRIQEYKERMKQIIDKVWRAETED